MGALSKICLAHLRGVDEHLRVLAHEVAKGFDCMVLEGVRTLEQQAEMVAAGQARSMESKHLSGEALDLCPYTIGGPSPRQLDMFGGYVLGVASMLGIGLRWGGDMDVSLDPKERRQRALTHFELVRRQFSKEKG